MVIKVGINGFGRIGRITFRTCLQNPEVELSAINDPAIDIEYICYLIKFDSTHGKFRGTITHTDCEITIDDHKIKVFREKNPAVVPWHAAEVQYVVEASGLFTAVDKASGHLASEGVRRVIVTAPSVDIPMIILGVNDNKLNAHEKVVSCASSTLYCLAPIIKVLNDNFRVEDGFITSIHAMTPSLKPLDGLCLRGKHWRDHRSIHQNIIPASTGACKALGKIIPQVKDKMTGMAFRVPIVNVSVLDITVRFEANTSLEEIVKAVEKASKANLHNIIRISNEEAVSSDFASDSHSCILDVKSSLQLKPNFFKLICWYENEYSYACRVLDTIFFTERRFYKTKDQHLTDIRVPCVRSQLLKTSKVVSQIEKDNEMSKEYNYDDEIITTYSVVSSDDSGQLKTIHKSPFVSKKPLSTPNSGIAIAPDREAKKKTEMIKVLNDENEAPKNVNNIKKNRSFFQSCIQFSPSNADNPKSIKAQERLENVKKEFSKMLDITEDLLKKSYRNKIQREKHVKDGTEVNDTPALSFASFENADDLNKRRHNRQQTSSRSFKECGDFKASNLRQTSKEIASLCHCEENDTTRDHHKHIVEKINKDNKDQIKETIREKVQRLESTSKAKSDIDTSNMKATRKTTFLVNNPKLTKIPILKSQNLTNNIDTMIDGLSVKLVENVCNELVKVPRTDAKKENDNVMNNEQDTVEPGQQSEINNSNTATLQYTTINKDKNKKYNLRDYPKFLQSKDHNIHLLDEELKKRNIIIINSDKDLNLPKILESELAVVDSNCRKNLELNRQILAGLNKLSSNTELRVEDNISPTDTAITNSTSKEKLQKQNLDDKLDSASATDSNNSFEMHERKSQVIHIADLTNSLEDLSRLDKICRIIEISDELSDKLFSKLDIADKPKVHDRKWSFRDLCERIQLDEFCNQIFGKTC